VIPFKNEIELLLRSSHHGSCNEVIIKHNGVNAVVNDLNDQKFYWAGLTEDVKKYVETCAQCNEELNVQPIKIPKVITSNGPFYRFIADLWQIPNEMTVAASSENHPNYKYILLCVDHFSKYTWGVLLEDKEAQTIVRELNIIFHHFKIPKIFQSDNGKEFKNKYLKKLCNDLKIKQIFGSVRHPQSQGSVEKLNDFLGRSLRIAYDNHINKGKKERFDIGNSLKGFINNQNNKIHSKTGYRANKSIMIEDEKIIEEVLKKVTDHYERRIKVQNKNIVKVGTKAFLSDDVTFDSKTNKIIPNKPKIKKKIVKNKKLKILVKVTDIKNIERNEVKIIILKRPPVGMELKVEYVTQLGNLSIAKNTRWDSIFNEND